MENKLLKEYLRLSLEGKSVISDETLAKEKVRLALQEFVSFRVLEGANPHDVIDQELPALVSMSLRALRMIPPAAYSLKAQLPRR